MLIDLKTGDSGTASDSSNIGSNVGALIGGAIGSLAGPEVPKRDAALGANFGEGLEGTAKSIN